MVAPVNVIVIEIAVVAKERKSHRKDLLLVEDPNLITNEENVGAETRLRMAMTVKRIPVDESVQIVVITIKSIANIIENRRRPQEMVEAVLMTKTRLEMYCCR